MEEEMSQNKTPQEEIPKQEEKKEKQPVKSKKKNVPLTVCWITTIFVLIFIGLAFWLKNPHFIIIGFLPAVIYEVIRTRGFSTKAASVIILILTILEILALQGIIQFNLATYLGEEGNKVESYETSWGKITFIFPVIVLFLSIVLFRRTAGIYTKWLSVIILISSIALMYFVNQNVLLQIFTDMLK